MPEWWHLQQWRKLQLHMWMSWWIRWRILSNWYKNSFLCTILLSLMKFIEESLQEKCLEFEKTCFRRIYCYVSFFYKDYFIIYKKGNYKELEAIALNMSLIWIALVLLNICQKISFSFVTAWNSLKSFCKNKGMVLFERLNSFLHFWKWLLIF